MKDARRCVLMVLGIVICLGCATAGPGVVDKTSPPQDGTQKLSEGIKRYEDGNYREAGKLLQEALNMGLPEKENQVKAHKYLAFIHCSSDRKKECADEFKKALELDPKFELQAAEAGHPLWGPVYSSVKGLKKPSAAPPATSPPAETAAPAMPLAPKEAQAAVLQSPPTSAPRTVAVLKTSHFREKPDNKSKILRILSRGEKMECVTKAESDTWLFCKLPSGLEGWILKKLVQ